MCTIGLYGCPGEATVIGREHQFLKGAWRLNVEHRPRSRARVLPRYTEIGVQCARRQPEYMRAGSKKQCAAMAWIFLRTCCAVMKLLKARSMPFRGAKRFSQNLTYLQRRTALLRPGSEELAEELVARMQEAIKQS